METTIPLKAKYRRPGRLYKRQWDPPQGTMCYNAGSHKSPGNNSGTKAGHSMSIRPRRRAWGPW